MLLNEKTYIEQPYCRSTMGAIFYFFGDPKNHIEVLEKAFNAAIELYRQPKGNESTANGYSFPFKGDPAAKFRKFLDSETFATRTKFELTASTKREVKEGRILVMASAPIAGGVTIPNFLYFEYPNFTDIDLLVEKIKQAVSARLFFLVLCNPVLAVNAATYPRSGSAAVKAITSGKAIGKCADDTWLNPDYRRILGRCGPELLDGPNTISAFNSDLPEESLSQIDWENALALVDRSVPGYIFLRASSPEDRKILAASVKNLVADLPKPRMFWKEELWNNWRARELSGAQGIAQKA